MNASEALYRLRRLGSPVVSNAEAATAWGLSESATTHALLRLAEARLVQRVCHGIWAVDKVVDPLQAAPALTRPYPCYGSTWTALARHGLIDQIPAATFVVSLDRAQSISTSFGTIVIQHIHSALYGGFANSAGIVLATPEKALFDTVYLQAARGAARISLPEITLPTTFDRADAEGWVERAPSKSLRTLTRRYLARVLDATEREGTVPTHRFPTSSVPDMIR